MFVGDPFAQHWCIDFGLLGCLQGNVFFFVGGGGSYFVSGPKSHQENDYKDSFSKRNVLGELIS